MSVLIHQLNRVSKTHTQALRGSSLSPLNHLRDLARRLADEGVSPPAEVDPNMLWSQVTAWIDSGETPRKLPLDVWKQVHRVLWMQHKGQTASAYSCIREGIEWTTSILTNRAIWLHDLAQSYVEATDVRGECLEWLSALLREHCEAESSPRAEVWKLRDAQFKLWSHNEFPAKFVAKLLSDPNLNLLVSFEDAGFGNGRALASDLSRHALVYFMERAARAAQGYDESHLQRVKEWKLMLLPEPASWSRELAALVLNGLLEPWATFNPPEVEFQKTIFATLEQWFGHHTDKWPGHWWEASEISRAIVARWKVLDVMEEFFQRVEDYAKKREKKLGDDTMGRHWRYRRQFWLAYYKRGVVTQARALIGRGMIEEFDEKALRKAFGKSMARLESRLNKHHCGLLLEMNGMMVIDLSHNGKAYFFHQGSERGPSPDALNYDRDHLDATADQALTHQGAESYSWQASFANFIARHTNVRVQPSEYWLRT